MRALQTFGLLFITCILVTFSLTACGQIASEPAPAIEGTDSMSKQTTTPEMIDWWQPTAGLTWQWQLTGKLNLDLQTDVIDIDLHVGRSVVDY